MNNLTLYNCRIWDVINSKEMTATAVSIVNGMIAHLGTDDDIRTQKPADTREINCNGKWLLPALTDAHTHFCEYAGRKLQVELIDCDTQDEALARIRAAADNLPPGSWITGGGWDKNRWDIDGNPDKARLDEISQQHFIAVKSKDWHSLWVNSAVLQLCNIDENMSDPEGGRIHRYPATSEPCGVLQERACRLVYQHVRPAKFDDLKQPLLETFAEFHRLGITAVHSVETPFDFAHCQKLYDQEELGLRVFWYFPLIYLHESEKKGFTAGRGNSFLKICGVKMFSDGALGSQTAYMLEAYDDHDSVGVPTLTPEELGNYLDTCVALKLPAAIHAIGDAANRMVLDAFEARRSQIHALRLRNRIEHAQLLHPDDIARFGNLNIIPSMQPIHLAEDIPLIERHLPSRANGAYAWKSLQDKGGHLIFGSDTPISSFDPWKGMYSAITRRQGCNPEKPSFNPSECLPLADAIRAYTINSAWPVYEEDSLGSISPGKYADVILIDSDIFDSPAEILLETNVLLTVQQGKIVYEAM